MAVMGMHVEPQVVPEYIDAQPGISDGTTHFHFVEESWPTVETSVYVTPSSVTRTPPVPVSRLMRNEPATADDASTTDCVTVPFAPVAVQVVAPFTSFRMPVAVRVQVIDVFTHDVSLSARDQRRRLVAPSSCQMPSHVESTAPEETRATPLAICVKVCPSLDGHSATDALDIVSTSPFAPVGGVVLHTPKVPAPLAGKASKKA
jgi:hypothetical protein